MPSLDDFFVSGVLGALAGGMTADDVRAALGEPEAVSGPGKNLLWKFGALQLGFHRPSREGEPRVSFIGLYFRGDSIPSSLGLSGWIPPAGCSYGVFHGHLLANEIPVRGGILVGTPKQLIIGNSVYAIFDEDDLLDSLQFTPARDRESTRKQVSMSLPVDVFDSIQAQARARGVSASELCSSWIEEKMKVNAV